MQTMKSMMTFTRLVRSIAAVVVFAIAGCGGGGGSAGTSPFGGGASGGGGGGTTTAVPEANDIVLVLSAKTLASTGQESVVATATALDANRNTVAGVPVTITVNNNGLVTPQSKTTDPKGQLNASIGVGSDQTARTMTVTAVSGGISKTAQLVVQEAGSSGGSGPSDLLLTLSTATVPNSGAQTATANITALDAKRNVLPGVVVSVSGDQGATVTPAGTTTGTNGVLSAVIGIGSNKTNRTIVVTASAGGLVRTAELKVVDAPATANPTAADLSIALSTSSLINGGTSTVAATITAVDSKRNALPGIPISVSVDNNAIAIVSGPITNAQGVVVANVGIGADRSNRSITITATSGTVTKSATISVIGALLTASYSPQVDAGSANNQIEYRLVDANGTPMAAQQISVTSPGLPTGAGQTDVNGKYSYSYTAPNAATTLSIVAIAAGDTRTQTVAVKTAGNSVPPAPSVPTSASLTPTPSVVSVNSVGSNTNQVELRALFVGNNNLPVPNVRVRFSVDPVNSSDGVASQVGGAIYAYSDATGVARGTFTPGQRSSPTNGVTVRACWDTIDFDTTAVCPTNRLVTNTLTIASEALSVNIRTNALIKIGAAQLTYIKEYVVMVVDAAGQAKPDVLITPSVDLSGYYKGIYFFSDPLTRWVQYLTLADTEHYSWNATAQAWQTVAANGSTPICPNEDVNRNGTREAGIYDPAAAAPPLSQRKEDLNWNGEIDPRKSDVAIKMVGSARTDANGLAIVQIEYGQNLASWVDYVITVTASGVAGTESRARYFGTLPVLTSAVTDKTQPPPFATSPYGVGDYQFVATVPPSALTTFVPKAVCTDTK
jgi:hypothetical protein